MTQLTYTVPTPGVNFSLEAPLVDTALTQILNTVNGNLDSSNLNMTTVGAALTGYVPGALLASKAYSPGSTQNYGVNANTWTFPDTTNLAITAIVPASGNVIVDVFGGMWQTNGNAIVLSGVHTASSGTPIFSQNLGYCTDVVGSAGGEGAQANLPYRMRALLTGLGSGSTTFYLAAYVYNTNGSLYVDGTSALNGGSMIMTVTGA